MPRTHGIIQLGQHQLDQAFVSSTTTSVHQERPSHHPHLSLRLRPASSAFSKKKIEKGATPTARRCGISGNDDEDLDLDGNILNTPAWCDRPDTPVAGTRPKHTRSGAASGSKESNLTSLYAFVPCCAGGSSIL